jgi:hypothetical protein
MWTSNTEFIQNMFTSFRDEIFGRTSPLFVLFMHLVEIPHGQNLIFQTIFDVDLQYRI